MTNAADSGVSAPQVTIQSPFQPASLPFMRFDSPNSRYDSSQRYDQQEPPTAPRRGTKMSKIRLDLRSKTPEEKAMLAHTHHDGPFSTSAHAATAVPSQAALNTAATDVDTALTDVENKKAALKAAQQVRDQKEVILDDKLTQRAKFCEAVSEGDGALLTAWGFELVSDPAPVGPLTAPQNLAAEMGEISGTMGLDWKAVRGSDSYVVECSPHTVPRVWTQVKIASKPELLVTGLTSGQTYAFRVRAVGPAGDGPWSDEAIKMAP